MRIEFDNRPIQDNNAAAQQPRSYIRIYPETNDDLRQIEWAITCGGGNNSIIRREALPTTGGYFIEVHDRGSNKNQ